MQRSGFFFGAEGDEESGEGGGVTERFTRASILDNLWG